MYTKMWILLKKVSNHIFEKNVNHVLEKVKRV